MGDIWLMSGGAPGADNGAAGATTPPPAGVGALSPVTRQTIAATVSRMIAPAAIHGSRSPAWAEGCRGAADPGAAGPDAAGAPHRWQNFAPAEMVLPHPGQAREAMAAPQLLQNWPVPATPQAGQGTGWDGLDGAMMAKDSRPADRSGAPALASEAVVR